MMVHRMSFYRGGIEYFCSEWLTHRTETNGVTKSYSFFFFNILEKEKNVSFCSFLKLGTENVNEWIKKKWCLICMLLPVKRKINLLQDNTLLTDFRSNSYYEYFLLDCLLNEGIYSS